MTLSKIYFYSFKCVCVGVGIRVHVQVLEEPRRIRSEIDDKLAPYLSSVVYGIKTSLESKTLSDFLICLPPFPVMVFL